MIKSEFISRSDYPILLQEYLKFCEIRQKFKKFNLIDLSPYGWFYPTCLLPLGKLLKKKINSTKYIPPIYNVEHYISIIMGTTRSRESTYVPIMYLPEDERDARDIISKLQILYGNGKDYGGINAFNFLIDELIDNIYTHSDFSVASVMAQRYEKKGFVEISIFDDGISIPGCFEKHGIILDDCTAVIKAVNGLSTKSKTRGFGLNSTTNIYVNGLSGELLLVSRNGALYKNQKEEKLFNLTSGYDLSGTLISIRVPYPVPEVDIHAYIS